MTVFTKSEVGDEKTDEKKPVPQVVVSPSPLSSTPSPTPPDDEPMGKKKRSSSFGPLSIIRLSPSPLARTPSPSPPEYDNDHWARLYRYRAWLVAIALTIFTISFVAGYFFHKSVAPRSVYHAWTDSQYIDNGHAERLRQNVEIDADDNYEKLQVPQFGANRPAIFIHDFKKNMTAIVDITAKRCFLKDLDRSTLLSPRALIDKIKKLESGQSPSEPRSVVRETFRVGLQLSQQDLLDLSSQMINRHCLFRPVFMLHKISQTEESNGRQKREVTEDVQFAQMGGDNVEVDHIIF